MPINWPIVILCAVGIAVFLTILLIPQILQVSFSKRLFDRPSKRKIHNGVIPRLGGFAFLPVMILTIGILLIIPALYSSESSIAASTEFIRLVPDVMVLFAAMMIMFLTGLYDDLVGAKYWIKFLAQIAAAIMIVEAGGYIIDYGDLFGVHATTVAMGKIITAFLIIYIVNALNLIDGVDGLAAGLCIVTLAFYGFALFAEGLYLFSLLSWVGVGTLAIFWLFNVFGSKRRKTKIFMGDIGSLTIGLLVAFLGIAVGGTPWTRSAWGLPPMIIMLSPLAIPLFDVIRVFCVRIMHGKSPFLPDKRHIHHIMLSSGLNMKAVMFLLIALQMGIIAVDVWLSTYWNINWLMILDIAIYGVVVVSFSLLNKNALK